MYFNKRTEEVLRLILENDNIKIEDISEGLKVSKRTVYYDITKINSFLEEEGINPVQNCRNKGIFLSIEDKKNIKGKLNLVDQDTYIYSSEERVIKIIISLLINENEKNLIEYEEELQVSNNTIIKDIKKVREILEKYSLRLENKIGYTMVGDELSKRYLFNMI